MPNPFEAAREVTAEELAALPQTIVAARPRRAIGSFREAHAREEAAAGGARDALPLLEGRLGVVTARLEDLGPDDAVLLAERWLVERALGLARAAAATVGVKARADLDEVFTRSVVARGQVAHLVGWGKPVPVHPIDELHHAMGDPEAKP